MAAYLFLFALLLVQGLSNAAPADQTGKPHIDCNIDDFKVTIPESDYFEAQDCHLNNSATESCTGKTVNNVIVFNTSYDDCGIIKSENEQNGEYTSYKILVKCLKDNSYHRHFPFKCDVMRASNASASVTIPMPIDVSGEPAAETSSLTLYLDSNFTTKYQPGSFIDQGQMIYVRVTPDEGTHYPKKVFLETCRMDSQVKGIGGIDIIMDGCSVIDIATIIDTKENIFQDFSLYAVPVTSKESTVFTIACDVNMCYDIDGQCDCKKTPRHRRFISGADMFNTRTVSAQYSMTPSN